MGAWEGREGGASGRWGAGKTPRLEAAHLQAVFSSKSQCGSDLKLAARNLWPLWVVGLWRGAEDTGGLGSVLGWDSLSGGSSDSFPVGPAPAGVCTPA